MEIIDVTFRESVLCHKQFEYNKVLNTIKLLAPTIIDYIEIGYLKIGDSSNRLQNYSPDYIEKCYDICKDKAKLALMMHPEDFSPNDYSKEIIQKLSLIRVTSKPDNIFLTKPIISYFKDLGIKTSINLLRSSKISDEESIEYCKIAKNFGADFFYIADSNGNLLPNQIGVKFKKLKQAASIKLGFHAHNNLGFALSNALEALTSGADILDSSLLGFGKGSGNLKTELFPIVLGRIDNKIALDQYYSLFKASQYFYNEVAKPNPIEEQFKFALYGLLNIDLPFDKMIEELSDSSGSNDYELAFQYIAAANGDIKAIQEQVKRYISTK